MATIQTEHTFGVTPASLVDGCSKHGLMYTTSNNQITAITLLSDLAVQGLTVTAQASAPGGRKDAKLTGLTIRMKPGQLLFYIAQWLEDVLTPTSPMSFHLNYRLPCTFLSSD
ncbi:unnamed protein product [Sphagnum troendelagicum]|uniref:Uncharacterized protein n=1 Tax=Sphagnum troendelagicum TaxID=128251 RepID=A0ABP0V599_9BRYO